jgi:hypothetical protein
MFNSTRGNQAMQTVSLPAPLAYDRGAQILEAHGHQHRTSHRLGFIQGQTINVHMDGSWDYVWEDIQLTNRALRIWLGY